MHRTLTYGIATTLDGYIAHPDGSYEGFVMEGPHVAAFESFITCAADVLMGRKTYEAGLAAGLPPGRAPYPGRRNHVFSRSLKRIPTGEAGAWEADPELQLHQPLHEEDVAAYVRRLKEEGEGPIWLCGGGELASTLMKAHLVDALLVKVNPVSFGQGRPLVAGLPTTVRLSPTGHTMHGEVLMMRYAVARREG